MDSKSATFGAGPLGIRMKGSPLGIRITHVDIGSAAINAGVKIGDFICGINGKPLKDLLKGEIGSGFSDTQLVELVNSMQRPITFNFNSMPTIAAAAAAETSSSSAPRVGPPVAITLPRGSSGTVYEKGPIKVGAGEKLLFPLPVSVGVGTKVIIEFWIAEEELDIWFSLQRKGKTDIVYPYTTKKHVGPGSFTMTEDEELSFLWDNSHSWFTGKTITYKVTIQ